MTMPIKKNISWITAKRPEGDEWAWYEKSFTVDKDIESAIFRFESDCTCAIYINDEFIISGTGRYPERVNCHEVTSKLKKGENKIKMVLGSMYFQGIAREIRNTRGYWLDAAAFELIVSYTDNTSISVPTDTTWQAFDNTGAQTTIEMAKVTDAEYERMWKNAAVWEDVSIRTPKIPDAVTSVVGEEYINYANNANEEYAYPVKVDSTNMLQKDGVLTPSGTDELPYVIFDFGRTNVGYFELSYNASEDLSAKCFFEFTETTSDFDEGSDWQPLMNRLSLDIKLSKDKTSVLNLRRRGCRFIKMVFSKNSGFEINGIKIRICMKPQTKTGYFKSSDEVLNKAWEVGKYTLQVNRQQEYESCPRNEMQFFSGDGAMDALVDEYAFGETDLMRASLSLHHEETSTGVIDTNKFNRITFQWDYYPWRVICLYNYYLSTGDLDFVKAHFDELKMIIEWMLERMNNDTMLIFQRVGMASTFTYRLGQTEWTCDQHRLGEKVALNTLLYKALVCMSYFADLVGENTLSLSWSDIAKKVKDAINNRLWDDKDNSYKDSLDDFIAHDTNTLAVLFNVAEGERVDKTLNTVKEKLWSPYGATLADRYIGHLRTGNEMISPFMCTLDAENRFINGRADEGIELMRNLWGTMLKKGANTFWEYTPNNADEPWICTTHAWSSGCVYLMGAYIMGVKKLDFNFKKISFKPNVCDLTHFKGVVPTDTGFIAVSYEKVDGKNMFRIAIPEAMDMEYALPDNSEIEIIKY